MKKIVTFFLSLCMILSLAACAGKEITVQSLYDATNVPALLEKHDSIYVQRTENDKVYEEVYFSKDYCYTFDCYNDEDNFGALSTDHSYYIYYGNMYLRCVILTPDGMADMESNLAEDIDRNIYSTSLLNDVITSVTEKDGQIIVKTAADSEEIAAYEAEGWTLGGEEHVLDAKTHELIFESAEYTKTETGENFVGAMRINYDGEIPESMKKFVEYDQQTENLRTVTVVSNAGTDSEKTESIQVPKGLQVAFTDFADDEKTYTLYADAACTQSFEEEWDADSDLTVYVKWGETPEIDPEEATYAEACELLEKGDYEAAYELFVSLGDYKDAAKKAAYFRYIPTGHRIEYVSDEESDTITYTVTLSGKNFPETVVEEYASGLKHTCTFTHNEFGFVTRRECSDTEGTTTLYEATYDENGNCLNETLTDKDGNVSKFDYTYNEKGEMVKVVTTDAPDYYLSCTCTYDEEGREIKAVYEYEDGITVEETVYNAEGKHLKKTWAEENGKVYSVYDYNYDENGRLVEIIFTEEGEDGGYRKATYDDKDQMISEHVFYTFGFEYTNDLEYDEHGNAIKTIYTHSSSEDETYSDVTESTYKLVYLPFDYTEEEWESICDSTKCWELTHW